MNAHWGSSLLALPLYRVHALFDHSPILLPILPGAAVGRTIVVTNDDRSYDPLQLTHLGFQRMELPVLRVQAPNL